MTSAPMANIREGVDECELVRGARIATGRCRRQGVTAEEQSDIVVLTTTGAMTPEEIMDDDGP